MNDIATISVLKLLGHSIHTREASDILIQQVEQKSEKTVELDFSKVEYISRSFADQFYFDKEQTASHTGKIIIVSNADKPIAQMLSAVSRTQSKKSGDMGKIPVFKFHSFKQIQNFLMGI